METATDFFTVTAEEAGERLDKLLYSHFLRQGQSFSRTYFQSLIEQGSVLINGKRLKKREKPTAGDEIEVCFLLTQEMCVEPEAIPLDILYEDEHLLAVNKPAQMVIHPAPGHPSGTFANALLYHCKTLPAGSHPLRPGIVHRLDKDTSGVLLAAKTPETHQKLVSLFSERKIKKFYLAVCIGNPGAKTISAPICRHPTERTLMWVDPAGKEAITLCTPLRSKGNLFLVEVQLITGRTHQIRVHFKHQNTPILGDPLYGSQAANRTFGFTQQLLHAHRILFTHPITGQAMDICAPIPPPFFHPSLP